MSDKGELKQLESGDLKIDGVLDDIINDNPDTIKTCNSNPKAALWIIGEVMRRLHGGANPAVIQEKLNQRMTDAIASHTLAQKKANRLGYMDGLLGRDDRRFALPMDTWDQYKEGKNHGEDTRTSLKDIRKRLGESKRRKWLC